MLVPLQDGLQVGLLGCVSRSSPVAVVVVLEPWLGNPTLNEHSHKRCATKLLLLFHHVPLGFFVLRQTPVRNFKNENFKNGAVLVEALARERR